MRIILFCLANVLLTGPALADAPETDPVIILQNFIRTRTVNPPGGESALTVPLAKVLSEAGMAVELTGTTQDRLNLIVRIPGSDPAEKPWLFLAHVDTVLADPAEWKVDPFSGVITDGILWGRGAFDDKGMAASLVSALLRLQQSAERPRVPLIVIFAVDEETGSKVGIEWLLETRPELFRIAGVINEGGYAILDAKGPARKTYYVSTGEKGVAWLRITAKGQGGHGSIRWGNNPNETLVAALTKITSWNHPESMSGPMGQFAMADLQRKGRRARSVKEALKLHPLGKQVRRDPKLLSTLSNTCNITVLTAGQKTNVIPGVSEARVDCRLVPGTRPAEFLAEVKRRIGDKRVSVELEFTSQPNQNPWQTPLFTALQKAARKIDKRSMVVPILSAGATDSRFWRERGILAYGIVPIPVPPSFIEGMHGKNERVPVKSVTESGEFLQNLLYDLGEYAP